MRLAWLWPLASWPDRDADGVFLSDRLVSEVSPGGRLDELVSTGAGRNVTWVVDPELLQAANAMSSGYQVMRDGKVTIGQNIAAARAWLDSVRGIAETADIHLVPYADIDAASSRRAGMSTDVIRAVTQAPAVASAALGASARNLIAGAYWAPFGRLDQDTATLLSSAGTSLLVLSAPQDSQSPVAAVGTPTGSVTAVLADRRLADLVSLPAQTTQDRILTRQEFLGRTLALSLARPGKAIVVAPESIRWNPDPELLGGLLRGTEVAPWVELVPLDQVLAAPGGALTRQRTVYGGAAKAAELPAPYMARVAAVNRDVGALGEILSDPAPIIGPFAEASLRTQSAAWRTAPKTADQLVSRVRKEIGQTSGLVAVLTSDTITFSGDTGAVPITVSNGLDQPVTVGVVLRGQPSPRLIAEPSEPVTIEPGGTASLEVQTRVVGSGAVSARAQLLTPQGEDFGTPATTMLTSTAYSRAASWVVIAAFVAIAVFVVVGVTRRIHGARSSKGASATVGS
jgi:hypothetical protein